MKCYQHCRQSRSLCISKALAFAKQRAGWVFGGGALETGFFQPPSGPDMGKLVGRWPFRCHQSPELLSHRCLSGAEAPLKGVGFGYSVCTEAVTGVSGFYDLPGGGVEVLSSPKACPASLLTRCPPAGARLSAGQWPLPSASDVLSPYP